MNAFEPSSCAAALRGPKHLSPPTQSIGHAQHQRRFRSDDRQIDAFLLRESEQRRNIIGSDVDIGNARLERGACVAGGDEYGCQRAATARPSTRRRVRGRRNRG